MILERWRDAVYSGRYFAVRYDYASESVAHWITRLATKVGLTGSNFAALAQTTAEQIGALSPAVLADEPMAPEPALGAEVAPPEPEVVDATPVAAATARPPSQPAVPPSPAQPKPDIETLPPPRWSGSTASCLAWAPTRLAVAGADEDEV